MLPSPDPSGTPPEPPAHPDTPDAPEIPQPAGQPSVEVRYPCVGVCINDPETGVCLGCGRPVEGTGG